MTIRHPVACAFSGSLLLSLSFALAHSGSLANENSLSRELAITHTHTLVRDSKILEQERKLTTTHAHTLSSELEREQKLSLSCEPFSLSLSLAHYLPRSILQHTANTATHCNTLRHIETHCHTQHTATHCDTLTHNATH